MKKIAISALVGIVLSVASYGVYKTQSSEETMSDFMLANVEALTDPEVDIPYICMGDEKACYDEYYHEAFYGYRVRI